MSAMVFVVDVPWGEVGHAPGRARRSRFKADYLTVGRRGAGHDHQPLPVLLAGRGGGRGGAGASRRQARSNDAPEQAPGRVPPHPHRHLCRHGAVEPRRLVHRHHHGRDAARPRRHRHPDLGPGRRGAAPDRRAIRLRSSSPLGIIGTGLLALPVLAGSAAYALGEALRLAVGLARKPSRAKAFYGAIAGGDPDRRRC